MKMKVEGDDISVNYNNSIRRPLHFHPGPRKGPQSPTSFPAKVVLKSPEYYLPLSKLLVVSCTRDWERTRNQGRPWPAKSGSLSNESFLESP